MKLKPTHIGLDIAKRIVEDLQPETQLPIQGELLELINEVLNESIGLDHAGLYRVANHVLTFIPFKEELFKRIISNYNQMSHNKEELDIYLVHLIKGSHYCYCIPFNHNSNRPINGVKGYFKII